MRVGVVQKVFRGHPLGGLFLCCATACGGGAGPKPPSAVPAEGPDEAFAELVDPKTTYESLGFVTGVREFDAVGRFAYLAGPADSTLVLFGLSFPNTALQFRRADSGYVARYRVTLDLHSAHVVPQRISRVEEVRVGTFRETSRREESVIFQARQVLTPGRYEIAIEVRDLDSGKGFRDQTSLVVPAVGPAGQPLSVPMPVYRVDPRTTLDESPSLILNPRATIPYGAGSFLVYIEGYADTDLVIVEVADFSEAVLWSDTANLAGAGELRNAVLSIVSDQLPVGALRLRARLLQGGSVVSTPILVGISERWILSNYHEILSLLRYAARPEELDSLRNASPEERAERWMSFWTRRDPIAATPENEYFDEYFARLREANRLFTEQQRPGWLTDRGEVYIRLGPPDQVFTTSEIGAGSRVRWVYDQRLGFPLRLDFIDRTGFSNYELTPDSRLRFRETVTRMER